MTTVSGRSSRAGNPVSRAVLLLLVAAGCGGEGGGGGRVEELSADSVHAMGTSELLARVTDLQPMEDGRVWVQNTVEPWFLEFTPAGELARAWGNKGEGPAEFRAPGGLFRGPGGGVWVYERGHHAITLVSEGDSGRQDLMLPRDVLPAERTLGFAFLGFLNERPWIEPYGTGFVLARRSLEAMQSDKPGHYDAELLTLQLSDTSLTRLSGMKDVLGDPASRYPNVMIVPVPFWSFCPDGTLAVYSPLSNDVRRLHVGGSEQAKHGLPAERAVEVTPERVFAIFYRLMLQEIPAGSRPDSAELHREMMSEMDQLGSMVASVFPEYAALQCDDAGNVWLHMFDIDQGFSGYGATWLRIAPDGQHRRIRFPADFWAIRFMNGRAWGVLKDEYDLATIAWVGVD